MNVRTGFCWVALMAVAGGCAPRQDYGIGQPLTAAQLAQLHATPVMATGGSPDGTAWTIRRFPGGSQVMQWSKGPQSGTDQGRYEIRGEQLCSRWQNRANAAEECVRYFAAGERYHSFAPDGRTLTGIFTVAPFTP